MAYREEIAFEIRELIKSAPDGISTHYLKHFDQEDVEDTVNMLHLVNPIIRETVKGYSKYTPIEIEK